MAREQLRHPSNSEANRLTREAICTAMVQLLDNKEFDKISISELVRRAGVSRQAFYRNYNTKEDVILEIEESILQGFAESIDNEHYRENPTEWFRMLFSTLKENQTMVGMLYKASLMEVLIPRLPGVLEQRAGIRLAHDLHYRLVALLGAIQAVCREWFANGMRESAEEMAEFCGLLMSEPRTDLMT